MELFSSLQQTKTKMAKRYTFTVHDESVNSYGFRMLTGGADLSEYEKNPVVFYNHNDYDAPIGKGYNIRKENGKILVDIEFDEDDPHASQIEGKVERGFLRMASVGTWPPEEASDDPALKLPGQTGVTVTKWTLREISVCPIGANHNALAMYDRLSGKRMDLSDKRTIVRLSDTINHTKHYTNMSLLTKLLKLSDSASEQAVYDAVKATMEQAERLETENASLKAEKKKLSDKVTAYLEKEKNDNKARAVQLVDAAVKDGRLNAGGRAAWLADFEHDFKNAEARLGSIAPRQAIKTIEHNTAGATTELRDMKFSEILRKDKLRELKQDKELYRQKFREAYGHDPE